ncbi:hypothetical protein AGMMS49928_14670 [Spirochaetia bacterium]|nr:hypothetical protein AGMMS49928_14670 [Spirochaetia bacterium]
MKKNQQNVITVLSIAVFILAFMISGRIWFRLDLTKNKAYTLSGVSRNLHREIPDQVRITYYLSSQLMAVYPQPGEIEDLLREYAVHSRGKIRYSRIDPAKTNRLQAMQQLGIPALEVEIVEKDELRVATVYAGVAVEYLDRVELLPVALSLDTVEYDITSRIRSLIRGTEREIGVIVGDSFRQWTRDFAPLNQTFNQAGFKIRAINPGDEIPDTLPSLFVFGGAEELDDWALYRIDRYLQGGGKIFFAPETISIDLQNNLETRLLMDKGLISMISFYGATVKPEMVMDQTALNFPPYQVNGPGGIPQFRVVRYPLWIGVAPENANPGHPLTARFGGLDLFWPAPITLNVPGGVEGQVLFSSTPRAWLQTKNFNANPELSYLFEQEAPDTAGTKVLGVSLSGNFPSYFEGMDKPRRDGSAEELPERPAETKPGRIVVIGDAEIGSYLLEYTQGRHNLDFILKAADWLGNDEDIIGIRNRQAQNGRLDKITDPVKKGRAVNFARVFNTFIIPLAVILAGLFLGWQRRKEKTDGR